MIVEMTKFELDKLKNFEGQTTIGNGKINIRGTFEEGLTIAPQNSEYTRYPTNVTLETKQLEKYSKYGTFWPRITGEHPLLNKVIVNLPYFIGIKIECGEEQFDMHTSNYENLNISLDTSSGELRRSLSWLPASGGQIDLVFKRFASFTSDQSIGQHLSIEQVVGAQQLTVSHYIDSEVTTSGYNHFTEISHAATGDQLQCSGQTNSGDQFVIKSKITVESGEPQINVSGDQKAITHRFNRNYQVSRCSNLSGCDFELQQDGYSQLFKQHLDVYQAEYNFARIEIEGSEQLQAISDFSIYHLLRSQDKMSSDYAICAKGFAGEAYFGHYFWDTEIFMLPFYTYCLPERARRLLEFRYKGLAAARENAEAYGYHGAKYPWEAGGDGSEQCPNWQYADFEIHVSADIVYAIDNYYQVTGDLDFIAESGLAMTEAIAEFFGSRMYKSASGYQLNGVMGPDEYMFFTNNNYFTNYMVNNVFKVYLKYCQLLAVTPNPKLVQLIDQLPLSKKGDVLLQCENFEHYEDIDLKVKWPNRNTFFAANISQEQNYRSKLLKQADVVNLFHLFEGDFEQPVVKASLDYYEPLTSHDSSLSKIVHTIVRCNLGQTSIADIIKAGGLDLYDCKAEEGIHIANAGGVWQAIFFGLVGAKNNRGKLEIDERELPPEIKRIKINVVIGGTKQQIIKTANNVEVLPIYE